MKGHIMKRIPKLTTFDRLTYNDRNRSDDYDLYPDLDKLMAVIDQDIKEETVREETRKALKTKICPECGGKLVKKWYSKKYLRKDMEESMRPSLTTAVKMGLKEVTQRMDSVAIPYFKV